MDHDATARTRRRPRQALASPSPSPSPSRYRPGRRLQAWASLGATDVLRRHPPGSLAPEKALEMLLDLFNTQHTALNKSVSHKTRHDRAVFLRRFLRDLRARAGFATVPDPRNLGGRHIQAMVQIWRQDRLSASTLQSYLSCLRGLAQWIGKPGLVLRPAAYGLGPAEYQRQEVAQRDKSWSGAGVEIAPLIAEVCVFDRHVGAALRLMQAFGLRRKEAVMLRPHACEVPFSATGLAPDGRKADTYLWVRQGAKGGRPRYLPIASDAQREALAYAQAVAGGGDAHVGDPAHDLRQNLNRFSYVVRRFGISMKERGATAHGLRHEMFGAVWRSETGAEPPVRGGARPAKERVDAARKAIAALAGHVRLRSAGAYVGSTRTRRPRASSSPEAQGRPPATGDTSKSSSG